MLLVRLASATAAALLLPFIGHANVRPHPLFTDNTVLQRDTEIPVWGWADPGEAVTVTLGTTTVRTRTGADGKWSLRLPKQAMNAKGQTLDIKGKNELRVKNVLIGDVWLCSGQSNMQWSLGACDAPEDIKTAVNPLIRHFAVDMKFARDPQDTVRGSWSICSPSSVPGFTAVGYYFARKVLQETGVPVGLLNSSVGGTNIECWMRQETLLGTPALKVYADQMRASLAKYQVELLGYHRAVADWVRLESEHIQTSKAVSYPPEQPNFPFGEQEHSPRCTTLHNGMIQPLIPFSVRGVLWYQGENNAGGVTDGLQYIEKQRVLIRDWRDAFGRPDMPFYSVALAGWQSQSNSPAGGDGWAEFRDAQRRALVIPHTGLASAVDIGDVNDIHPKNKLDVGERLALWALRDVYGKSVTVSGPLLRDVSQTSTGTIRITFDHLGKGLTTGRMEKPGRFVATPQLALGGFSVAGADKVWHVATASIDGDVVVVRAQQVKNPLFVRYGYRMHPLDANLYNKDGLPALPFRTDDGL